MAKLHYYLDWNNNRLFDHARSDVTAYVMSASWRLGRNASHEYDSAGTASLTLDNSSSIFSSFNAAGPLYGRILPNIRVRITMTSGGITTTMFQGFLESIVPTVGFAPGARLNTAELVAYGALAQFNEGTVSVPLQENIDTGAAISASLDADGYSETERSIQAGLTTISKWWARPGSSRIQVMRELQSAEFGRLREAKNGFLCYENRANPFMAPRNIPQAVYGSGDLRMWNLRQENPLLGVFNTISSEIHTFNVSEEIVLVTIADVPGNQGGVPPIVPGNGSLTIDIGYPTASSPGNYIAVDSWGMVDYEANTKADRTGLDITHDVSATKTSKGSRLTVAFTNSNPQPAHLVVLRARGVAIVEGDPIPVSSEDAASQAKYRKREYPYPSPWLTYLPDGKTYCDYIISVFKDLRPRLTFDVKGDYNDNHLDEVRQRDIGDRIRVVASLADYGLAIDAEFIIDSLSYSVDASGLITMLISCTQAPVAELGPLATPYAPKTIPEPTGQSDSNVPGAPSLGIVITRDANGMSRLTIGASRPQLNAVTAKATEIEIARDPEFASLAYRQTGPSPFNDTYMTTEIVTFYGRARTQNCVGWGPWSDTVTVKDEGDVETSDTDVPSAPLNVSLVAQASDPSVPGNQLVLQWDAPAANKATLFGYDYQIDGVLPMPSDSQLHLGTSGQCEKGSYVFTDPSGPFIPAWAGRTLWVYDGPADQHHMRSTGVIVSVDSHSQITIDSQLKLGGSGLNYEIVVPSWEQVRLAVSVPTKLLDPAALPASSHFRKVITGLECEQYYVRVRGSNAFGLGYWSDAAGPVSLNGINDADLNTDFRKKVLNSTLFAVTAGAFSNNSPSFGYVSWTNIKVQYQNEEYSIANGNTNLKYIYWSPNTPAAFTSSNLLDLSSNKLIVAINNTGYCLQQWSTGSVVDASVIYGSLSDSQIAAIAASKVTGQLQDYQLAGISAAKLTTQITQTNIADGAVSTPKLAAGAVTANEIAANTITAAQIASGSITGTQIAAGTIQAGNIAAGQISSIQLAANSVIAGKIAADAVDANQIKANAVIAGKIAAGAVDTAQLAAGCIQANNIAAGAITAEKISAGAITADKIQAGEIVADKIRTGSIQIGHISEGTVSSVRGDVTAWDWTYVDGIGGDLVVNGNYQTLDLSGIVPAGYRMILLNYVCTPYAGAYFIVRKYGRTNEVISDRVTFAARNYDNNWGKLMVACDENRRIQYKAGAWSTFQLVVAGYWT